MNQINLIYIELKNKTINQINKISNENTQKQK